MNTTTTTPDVELAPSQYLRPGTTLKNGTYVITSLLDEGGFGKTYIAEHISMERKVCIKEFYVNGFCTRDIDQRVYASSSELEKVVGELKARFIKEASILATIDHPNVVRVHDAFGDYNTAYYVMEFIEGETLSNILVKQGALSEKQALLYLNDLSSALAHIHSRNMLHLDIKPSNIMVRKSDNKAILIDFGLTKRYNTTDGGQTSPTHSGTCDGYTPIEQYDGGIDKFSPEIDIYALGATLFAMLTGMRPPKASLVDLATLIPANAKISKTTQRAIKSAMQFKSHERPHSGEEFMTILATQRPKFNKWWITLPIALIILSGAAYLLFEDTKSDNEIEYVIQQAKSLWNEGDKEKSFKRMLEAADYENEEAMLFVAICYMSGEGVDADIAEAIKLFKKCANKGNDTAMFYLGECYMKAGKNQDTEKAIKQYKKAADKGNLQALCQLGVIYINGNVVPRDSALGIEYLTTSSEGGYAQAQYLLGKCYLDGTKGITKDYERAQYWLQKAADQGYEKAKNEVERLKKKNNVF